MVEFLFTLSQNDWSLHRQGPIDQARHNAKVREAIRGNLPAIIGDESIIASDGTKTIKIPMRSLELPHFRFKRQTDEPKIGQGTGNSKKGDVLDQGTVGAGSGPGADEIPGIDYYEAELTIEELSDIVFADLGLPDLKPKGRSTVASDAFRFSDVRRSGPLSTLAKKRTLLENLKRNALKGHPRIGGIKQSDLRFRTWERDIREENDAVVIAIRDVSGSMGEFEKHISRTAYFWLLQGLRRKYHNVQTAFIVHHETAKEVDETAFFTMGESGGTLVSSAYLETLDLIGKRFNPQRWNIYPFHFTDGDNGSVADTQRCLKLIEQILGVTNRFCYAEIHKKSSDSSGTLMNYFQTVKDTRLVMATISGTGDIIPAIKTFLTPGRSIAA